MRRLASLALLAAAAASATTAERLDVPALTASASDVVRARVVASAPRWTGDHRRIVTDVRLEVVERWKGDAPARITVVQPGGELDGLGQRVDGVTALVPGDEVVLFLERAGATHRLVGMAQGVYRVTSAPGVAARAVPADLAGMTLVEPKGRTAGAREALALPELKARVQGTEPRP